MGGTLGPFWLVLVGFGNFERPWSYFREGQESDVTGSTIHEGRWTGPTYLYSDLRVPTRRMRLRRRLRVNNSAVGISRSLFDKETLRGDREAVGSVSL
jgi:hypothetical protein